MHLYDIEAIVDDTRYHVVVLASDAQAAIDLDHLRAKLAIIKDKYQQDVIALIVGSELL